MLAYPKSEIITTAHLLPVLILLQVSVGLTVDAWGDSWRIGLKPKAYTSFVPYLKVLRTILYYLCIYNINDNSIHYNIGAVVAQLASARLSEQEVSGSIVNDLNVCFDFPLIRVAIALNTRNWNGALTGTGVKGAPLASIDTILITEGTTDVK